MKQVSIMEYEQREDGSVSTRPLFVDQFIWKVFRFPRVWRHWLRNR